jgi:hypothetical protein
MPTFRIWNRTHTPDADMVWVYAIDEWDARNQIADTLCLDAHDEIAFACEQDDSVAAPSGH